MGPETRRSMADENQPNSEAKFTQADLDKVLGERLAKEREKFKDYDAVKAQLAEITEKLAKSDEERQAALEAKELEGKSELEKLKINLEKANKTAAEQAAAWAKKHADAESAAKSAYERFIGERKSNLVTNALVASGVRADVAEDALYIFMRDASFEIGEDHSIKGITVGGKAFEKAADAAKHFLTTKPTYAQPPKGGAGTGPNPGGPGKPGNVQTSNADEDFAFGLSKH